MPLSSIPTTPGSIRTHFLGSVPRRARVASAMGTATPTRRRATSGLDLRLARVAARVTVTQLAAQLGVTHQRVSSLEGSERPTVTAVSRYMTALEQLR